MAQTPYRVNLTSARFPLMARNMAPTVIQPGLDANYVPGLTPNVDGIVGVAERGQPQIMYCENVMPSTDGLQSIGYRFLSSNIATPGNSVNRLIQVRGLSNEMTYISIRVDVGFFGEIWKLLPSGPNYAWTQVNAFALVAGWTGAIITKAYVNGRTFLYFQGATDPLREYIFASDTLAIIPVVVFNAQFGTEVPLGIVASSGYLLGYSTTRVAWSSTVSPTDFVPSLVTGAGGSAVQDLKGGIRFALSHKQGFIMYCAESCTAGIYTNNKNFPFNFRNISGSGGCENPTLVSTETSNGSHIAMTNAGLQELNTSTSRQVYPDINDFISGRVYETYDYATNAFTYLVSTDLAPIRRKLAIVATRYLCISYGIDTTTLDYVIVVDLVTGKYGKLKKPHVEILEWDDQIIYPNREASRESIAVLQTTGDVSSVTFSTADSVTAEGLLLLGRYQHIRQRLLQLQEVSLTNVFAPVSTHIEVSSSVSFDGTEQVSVAAGSLKTGTTATTRTAIYRFNKTGLNHMLRVKGSFYLTSLAIWFINNGRR